jgi:hypothetical protein
VLDAVAMLRKQGFAVRILMLNAEYPDPVSKTLVLALRDKITRLGLSDIVDFRSTFLPDAEAAALLGQADLILFPYQDTQESASGAIRHGMATRRPVMVTPVPIFDELGGAVYRTDGRDPKSLADGLQQALRAEIEGSTHARDIALKAQYWRQALDVKLLASRLQHIASGLWKERRQSGDPREFTLTGANRMLRTQVGQLRGSHMRSQAKAGHLMFGPYLQLPPGSYVAKLKWCGRVPKSAHALLKVVAHGGESALAECELYDSGERIVTVELPFRLARACADLEIQVRVDQFVQAEIVSVAVRPSRQGSSSANPSIKVPSEPGLTISSVRH